MSVNWQLRAEHLNDFLHCELVPSEWLVMSTTRTQLSFNQFMCLLDDYWAKLPIFLP
jgi:hypothetical protein